MKKRNSVGSWAFLIGVILAIVLGLGFGGTYVQTLTIALIIVGFLVGLFNIVEEEATPYLMSGTVLVIVSSLGGQVLSEITPVVGGVLQALLILFVPATIIVAIKHVFTLAHR